MQFKPVLFRGPANLILFAFNLFVSLCLKYISYKQHMVKSYFLI